MKYVMMFVETEQFQKAWEASDDAERQRGYEQVGRWFAEHADQIVSRGAKLQPAHTATTVRLDGGEAIVTDGPFLEGKEVISGFIEVEATDLDEVLRMARTWPGCPTVEIRPVAAVPVPAP